ncbi:MAG: ABC transporter ATP-binding protein [Firmicutes bacterium]|nr:ABC transporter ATP-binding protein [Bacillota bacterium]
MTIVEVNDLSKKYGELMAVNGLSFSIEEGEIFGFLGPNGAGKTSTINMLTGLSRPTSGQIMIAGFDAVKEVKRAQRIMGVVADESNLYGEMNGFDNLCFCAALYGMRKAEREQRAGQLLAEFQLTGAQDRPFRAYSKGMRRKLTIAAALIHQPKILFLDEPTTGIDVASARQIRKMIKDLKKQGTTVFITTHYIEEAERICDRIAFLVDGKIVRIGTVAELMADTESEHQLELTLDRSIPQLVETEFKQHFPSLRLENRGENASLLAAPHRIALSPILRYLEEKGIAVYEAREVRPSLEEVFVKITGIEATKLNPEKEGGKQ